MKKPRVIDLFAGTGGISLGLKEAGLDVVVANDIWDVALKTHRLNQPDTETVVGDICQEEVKDRIKKAAKGKIDIIVGGPPCQGFSAAGMRLIDDPRNHLFKEFVALVDRFEPQWFLMENVWNLPLLSNGKVKDMIIEEFTKLGYRMDYGVLLAADYGVPQLRKRCFFIGNNQGKDLHFPGPKYAPAEHFSKRHITKYKNVRSAIGDLPPISAGESYPGIPNHACAKINELNLKRISFVPEGGYAPDIPEEIRPKETKRGGYFYDWYRRLTWNEPSRTIIGADKLFHPQQNRKLSVRECARLQSFPDSYMFLGSLRDQYKQIGNAVPPLLAKAWGKILKLELADAPEEDFPRNILSGQAGLNEWGKKENLCEA